MLSLSISSFGIFVIFRTLQNFSKEKTFEDALLIKIGTVFSILLCFAAIFFAQKPLLVWLIVFTLLILVVNLPFFVSVWFRSRALRDLISFLDQLIITMRAGNSLRNAVSSVIREHQSPFRPYFYAIFQGIVFENEKLAKNLPIFWKNIFNHLVEIDKTPHRAIDQLIALRKKLRVEEKFRHKSRQVRHSIEIQVVIMSIFYVGLYLLVIFKWGFLQNASALLLSAVLFFVGVLLAVTLGRHKKWKV